MTHFLDLKAIGYGVATFALGYLLLGVPATIAANFSGSVLANGLMLLVQIGGIVVPAIAGYVSAFHAKSWHIAHGAVGGTLGIVLLVCVAAIAFPDYPAWGIPAIVVRSAEHTSELQSLMSISYAVFFLNKQQQKYTTMST